MSDYRLQLEKWMQAAASVADAENMSDDEVIPTWPVFCVETQPENYPELTVGAVRAWKASHSESPNSSDHIADAGKMVSGAAQLSGYSQRSDAWIRVTELLDEVAPHWQAIDGSGAESALNVIRKMASVHKRVGTYSDIVSDGGLDPRNAADKQAVSVPEWIKCSERLPRLTGRYLVALSDPDDIGWNIYQPWQAFWSGESWEDCDPIEDGQPVSHWMPLPDMPEQEQGHES